jgi:tetratricopeptide (TPR) repeat protein
MSETFDAAEGLRLAGKLYAARTAFENLDTGTPHVRFRLGRIAYVLGEYETATGWFNAVRDGESIWNAGWSLYVEGLRELRSTPESQRTDEWIPPGSGTTAWARAALLYEISLEASGMERNSLVEKAIDALNHAEEDLGCPTAPTLVLRGRLQLSQYSGALSDDDVGEIRDVIRRLDEVMATIDMAEARDQGVDSPAADSLYLLGHVSRRARQWDCARSYFDAAIEMDEAHQLARSWRPYVLRMTPNSDRAAVGSEIATLLSGERDDGTPIISLPEARANLLSEQAVLLEGSEGLRQALACYEKAWELRPDTFAASAIVDALTRLNRPADAILRVENAMARFGDDADLLRVRGQLRRE